MAGGNKKKNGARSSAKRKNKGKASGLGSEISRAAGQVLGQMIPEIVGSLAFPASGASASASPQLALGQAIGRRLKSAKGYDGSMALSAPAANGTYVRHGKARMRNAGTGMRVTHREYVEDVVFGPTGTYTNVVAEPINPGNRNLFPWLSSIALRFETYRFNSLRFIYEPQCGTDNEGTVMVAVDFDAVDDPPVDKLQIMTYDGAVRSPPWFAAVYNCAPSNLHKYKEYFVTPNQTTPTTTDQKTYFVGRIYVATQSLADPFTSGELYVEYDVTFLTPQLSQLGSVAGHLYTSSGTLGGTWTTAAMRGQLELMLTQPESVGPLSPLAPLPPTGQTYIIPTPGMYLINLVLNWTDAVSGTITVGLFTDSQPEGFTQSGEEVFAAVDDPPFLSHTYIVADYDGPVFFWIAYTTTGTIGTVTAQLLITPLDSDIASYYTPFLDPPITTTMTAVQRYLARQKAKHASRRSVRKLLTQVAHLEEEVKSPLPPETLLSKGGVTEQKPLPCGRKLLLKAPK
jgi:hypothetical protein